MARARHDRRHTVAKSVGAESERPKRTAVAAREHGEHRREAAETRREAGERRRESAETARTIAERGRVAAEIIREDAITTATTTAEALQLTLARMEALEELRRTLRAIADPVMSQKN